MNEKLTVIDELKLKSDIRGLEFKLNALKNENASLKARVDTLRRDNDSYLYSALAKFQGEMPVVLKDSVIYGNQKFASFSGIKKLATPILAKYGLSVCQDLITVDGKEPKKLILISHCGQRRESIFIVPIFVNEKTANPRNEVASSITFFLRRTYSSALGIVTAEE